MKTLTKHVLRRLHHDERGSAITEFTIFLPVWIVLFYGLLDMGFSNITISESQITTQTQLWHNTISLMDPCEITALSECVEGDKAMYMSPFLGAAQVATHSTRERNKLNGRTTINQGEAAVHGVSLLGGHWGEAYGRTILIPGKDVTPKLMPSDVIGEAAYPTDLLDDNIDPSKIADNFSGGSISSLVAGGLLTALQGTGSLSAIAAGARYGTMSAQSTGEHHWKYFIGGSTVTPEFAYDTLVAPVPIIGSTAGKTTPWMIARMAAEAQENYAVMMIFGQNDWGGSEGMEIGQGKDTKAEGEEKGKEELQKKCDDGGFGSLGECESCMKNGHTTHAACFPPPPPNP